MTMITPMTMVWTEVGTVEELESAYQEAMLATVRSHNSCIIEVNIDPLTNREHYRQVHDLVMERCGELLQ